MIYLNTDDLSYTLTYYFFVCLFDSVFRIKILALPRLLAKRFLVSQTDLHKFTTIYIAERWKIYLKNFKVHHCINFFIYPGTFLAHRMNILRSWCSFVINVLWLWINFTQFVVFIFELEQENVGWLAGWLMFATEKNLDDVSYFSKENLKWKYSHTLVNKIRLFPIISIRIVKIRINGSYLYCKKYDIWCDCGLGLKFTRKVKK